MYYRTVNNKLSIRKSGYFNFKNVKKDWAVMDPDKTYGSSGVLDKVVNLITAILLFAVIGYLLYICFGGLIASL